MNTDAPDNCRNIIIRGRGTIWAGGQGVAGKIIEVEVPNQELSGTTSGARRKCENCDTIGPRPPRLINLSNCVNVWISGSR